MFLHGDQNYLIIYDVVNLCINYFENSQCLRNVAQAYVLIFLFSFYRGEVCSVEAKLCLTKVTRVAFRI